MKNMKDKKYSLYKLNTDSVNGHQYIIATDKLDAINSVFVAMYDKEEIDLLSRIEISEITPVDISLNALEQLVKEHSNLFKESDNSFISKKKLSFLS